MSTRQRQIAILVVGALASASAPARAQEHLFPSGRRFERPLASPRVHGVVGRLLSVGRGESRFGIGREAEVALGENFPIVAFTGGAFPITLGFGTEVYGRFSLDDPRSALISNDWLVGLNATAHLGRWDLTLELFHESSHLGDEYGDRFNEPRLDWTREALTGWASYTVGHWRLTGAATRVLIDQLGLARTSGAVGIDYRGPRGRMLGGALQPVGGIFADADAATQWRVSTSARLGVALSSRRNERELSISLIGHDGLSTQRQFFGRRSRYIGLELRFDL